MNRRNKRPYEDKPRRYRGGLNRLGRKLKRSIVYLWPDGRDQRFFSPKNTTVTVTVTGSIASLEGVHFHVGVDMGVDGGDRSSDGTI